MSERVSDSNRRAAYRVEPSDIDELDLTMLARRQRLVPAAVRDVSTGGARVSVDPQVGACIEHGDEVSVSLVSKRHDYDGDLSARVVATGDDTGARVVHLSFLGDTHTLNDPPPGVRALFNRRATYRGIGPQTCADFNALISAIGGGASMQAYPVSVRNISNSGVSVELDRLTHKLMKDATRLRLTLELPGHVRPTTVACTIRHRAEENDAFIYGCEYDWADTLDSLGVVEDLAAYLLDSIADEMRTRRER